MNLVKASLLVFVIASTFTLQASGQNVKIDSLEILLKKHSNADIAKVNLINALAYELFSSNPQKAKDYAEEAWIMASSLNYQKGKAASLWITGLTSTRNDKKKALDYFQKALEIAKTIDDKTGMSNYLTAIGNVTKSLGDIKASNKAHEQALQIALKLKDQKLILKSRINIATNMTGNGNYIEAVQQLQEVIKLTENTDENTLLAKAYSNLGSIYRIQGDYPTALGYYLSALKLNEETNNTNSIFYNFVNIAGIQSEQKDFSTALNTIQKALRISEARKDSMLMSVCFTNIGNIYHRTNHPDALDYFKKALAMAKGSEIRQNINNLLSVGEIYSIKGEFEKATNSFNEALALALKADLKNDLCEVYIKIGALYLKQRKYPTAIEYTQKSLNIAEKTAYTEVQKDCNKQLSDIYATTGNFKDAYIYHTQYKLLDDSIFNGKNIRKTALLESSYNFAKEREVYELEKTSQELKIENQQQAILSLAIISLLVLLLLLTTHWSSRLKKKVLRLEIEKMNQELEDNQKAMAVAKLKLVQGAERDMQHVKMLEDIEKTTAGEEQKSVRTLISTYKSQTIHSNWEEFETLFTKINTSFLDKLNELYPTLTSNERKLCVFLKLNMSNKDIAQITLQSEEALKKSRLRLRKKLEIDDRSTNLMAFIQSI